MSSTQTLDWIIKVMDIYLEQCKSAKQQRDAIEEGMDDWFDDLLNNQSTHMLNSGSWDWGNNNSRVMVLTLQPTDDPNNTTYYRFWEFDYLDPIASAVDTANDDYNRAMRGI
jgi:hypothetical protein